MSSRRIAAVVAAHASLAALIAGCASAPTGDPTGSDQGAQKKETETVSELTLDMELDQGLYAIDCAIKNQRTGCRWWSNSVRHIDQSTSDGRNALWIQSRNEDGGGEHNGLVTVDIEQADAKLEPGEYRVTSTLNFQPGDANCEDLNAEVSPTGKELAWFEMGATTTEDAYGGPLSDADYSFKSQEGNNYLKCQEGFTELDLGTVQIDEGGKVRVGVKVGAIEVRARMHLHIDSITLKKEVGQAACCDPDANECAKGLKCMPKTAHNGMCTHGTWCQPPRAKGEFCYVAEECEDGVSCIDRICGGRRGGVSAL